MVICELKFSLSFRPSHTFWISVTLTKINSSSAYPRLSFRFCGYIFASTPVRSHHHPFFHSLHCISTRPHHLTPVSITVTTTSRIFVWLRSMAFSLPVSRNTRAVARNTRAVVSMRSQGAAPKRAPRSSSTRATRPNSDRSMRC